MRLHCLVTASVIVPGLVPGCDPARDSPTDTMQVNEEERGWLLERLATSVPGRFVLISGDYHVSFAGVLRRADATVGAIVVAPPFYAPLPYANAGAHDLWLAETIRPQGAAPFTLGALD